MSSPPNSCYLRFRGRISGPFPFERVKEMADSGLVSPIHEFSADRTSWKSAGSIPELFPAIADRAPTTSGPGMNPPTEKWFYINANAQRCGPVSRDELLRLFDSGVVGNETTVWRSGLERWILLADTGLVPERVTPFQKERSVQTRQTEPNRPSVPEEHPTALRPGVGKGIASMVLGILSLLFSCVSFFPYLILVIGPLQLIVGILGIVFGAVGMKTQGRGFAIAGLICGIIGVSLITLVFIITMSFAGMVAFQRGRWDF